MEARLFSFPRVCCYSVTFLNEFCRVCVSRWALALKPLFRQLSGWPVVRDFLEHVKPASLPVFVRALWGAGHSQLCLSLHFPLARALRSAGAEISGNSPVTGCGLPGAQGRAGASQSTCALVIAQFFLLSLLFGLCLTQLLSTSSGSHDIGKFDILDKWP